MAVTRDCNTIGVAGRSEQGFWLQRSAIDEVVGWEGRGRPGNYVTTLLLPVSLTCFSAYSKGGEKVTQPDLLSVR